MKTKFEMTDEELDKMKSISQSRVPVMKFGDYWSGMDTQERANSFWQELGKKYGFVWDSVESGGNGNIKEFLATKNHQNK